MLVSISYGKESDRTNRSVLRHQIMSETGQQSSGRRTNLVIAKGDQKWQNQ